MIVFMHIQELSSNIILTLISINHFISTVSHSLSTLTQLTQAIFSLKQYVTL